MQIQNVNQVDTNDDLSPPTNSKQVQKVASLMPPPSLPVNSKDSKENIAISHSSTSALAFNLQPAGPNRGDVSMQD